MDLSIDEDLMDTYTTGAKSILFSASLLFTYDVQLRKNDEILAASKPPGLS